MRFDGGTKGEDSLSASLEDYLEAIYLLELAGPVARARDIAERLGVGRSSVSAALKVLAEKGYLDHSPYQTIALTGKGRATAREILRRHEILQAFLEQILGVEHSLAEKSACAMEHAIRGEVLERLLSFVEFFSACPRGRKLMDEFRKVCNDGFDPGRCGICLESAAAGAGTDRSVTVGGGRPACSLASLEPGERGVIRKIGGDRRFRKRIADLGVTRGAVIEVERVAPMGDPIQVKVRGYHLSMRKNEAADISVEKFADGCGAA